MATLKTYLVKSILPLSIPIIWAVAIACHQKQPSHEEQPTEQPTAYHITPDPSIAVPYKSFVVGDNVRYYIIEIEGYDCLTLGYPNSPITCVSTQQESKRD